MYLELRHLRSLRAIQQSGNLARAAERLHVTQSALSHQLKDLEHRLGVALLVRRTRPVRFTTAGLRVLALGREILPRVQQTERELKRLAAGQTGRLHIAIECHSCFQWLMPALDAFREHWPEVELDLTQAHSFDPLPALRSGRVDLVITSDPQADPALVFHPLFSYESLLAVAASHVLAKQEYVSPADLADETLITYPVDPARLDVFSRFLSPVGVQPAAVRRVELTPLIVQLVASGRGVCALPAWALEEYRKGNQLQMLRLGKKGLQATLYAAIRAEDGSADYLDAFLQQASRTCFAQLPDIRQPVD